MSPGSRTEPPTPAAIAMAGRLANVVGVAVRDARRERRWTTRDLAARARISAATVINVEAGRAASVTTYARLAAALGLVLDVSLRHPRRRSSRPASDVVHAAMGEWEASRLGGHRGCDVAIDHPYQHYQFAGRADVLAWTMEPAALLHIENRTRFPDLQAAIGSYNAKREFLAATIARQIGIRRFDSETHVMAGLWSAEVIHAVRLRQATFRAVCPDPPDRFAAWLAGKPPNDGASSAFILLDPFATGRSGSHVDLERSIASTRPRWRGYADAARRAGG